jgi:hypothetical protein
MRIMDFASPAAFKEIKVDNSLKCEFKTTTRLQNFDVFMTAESDPATKVPSDQVVLKADVQV